MVAYDSRRMPDPAFLLAPATVAALRGALEEQRVAGPDPTPALTVAIRNAATEARERQLQPEALVIQLKALADEVGLPATGRGPDGRRVIREWMITACLRAYWASFESDHDANSEA
jgi:hypothetical protein